MTDNAWKCIICVIVCKISMYRKLNHSIHLNVTHYQFFIGYNTFIMATTASSRDITANNVLMNSLVLALKWPIGFAVSCINFSLPL